MCLWATALKALLRRPPDAAFVDVEDVGRKRLIREAEYNAGADAGSGVLRVSGRPTAHRRLTALTSRERIRCD